MRSASNLFFLICHLLIFGCGRKNIPPVKSNESISLLDFRHIKGKNNGDELAFRAAIEFASRNKISIIRIPAGIYNIQEQVFFRKNIRENIKFIGEGYVEFRCSEQMFSIDNLLSKENIFLSAKRGDRSIFLKKENTLIPGDFIAIRSNKKAETAWEYIKSDIHKVKEVRGEKIIIEDGLNFSYDISSELVSVSTYRPKILSFNNITFNFVDNSKTNNIVLHGVSLELINVKFKSDTSLNIRQYFNLQDCIDVDFSNIEMKNSTYGVLFNNCRNVKAINTIANNIKHPYVPATWSTNLYFQNIRGKNTSIDAHPSFDVTYKDVDIFTGDDYFNCRSLGVTLIDCKFRASRKANYPSLYIGMSTLDKDYSHLYQEYSITIENVDWVHDYQKYNGLHFYKAKKITIKNSKTHLVSTSAPNDISIEGGTIGQFRCYDNNYAISNVIFDGRLLKGSKENYPLSVSFGGKGYITNCQFGNYEKKSSRLLEYIHYPDSNFYFKNCTFDGFSYIVKELGYSKKKYNGIEFINCTLKNINADIQKNIDLNLEKNNKLVNVNLRKLNN